MMWKRALWLWRSVKFWWYITAIWWCTMFCCIDTLESASLSNQHRAGMVLLGGPTFRKWIGINPLNTNHQVIFLHLHHFLWDANLFDIHPVHGPIVQHGPIGYDRNPRDRKEWSSVTPTIWWTCQLMVPRPPHQGMMSFRTSSWKISHSSMISQHPFISLKSLFHWGVRWSRDLVMQHATDTLLLPLRDGHAIAKLASFSKAWAESDETLAKAGSGQF